MKFIELADLHHQGGALHVPVARAWNQVYDIAQARGVIQVHVAGDVVEDANLAFMRSNTVGDIHRAILSPIMRTGIHTVLLKGNHDDISGHHAPALACFEGVPEITVATESKFLVFDEGRLSIACLPWEWNNDLRAKEPYASMANADFDKAARKLRADHLKKIKAAWKKDRKAPFKVLLGHAEIDGALNRYRPLPEGCTNVYSMGDLEAVGADLLTFGHYHGRQLAYVGSMIQLDFGEEGNPTGFRIVDTENGAIEWVDVTAPRYYTVRTEEYESTNKAMTESPQNVEAEMCPWEEGDHIKVRGERRPVLSDQASALGIQDPLPPGVIFEPTIMAPPKRAGVDVALNANASVPDLIMAWCLSKVGEIGEKIADPIPIARAAAEPLIDLYSKISNAGGLQIPQPFSLNLLPIDRFLWVDIKEIGPHRNTRLNFDDGLTAIIGDTGSGKTFAIEAMLAAMYCEFIYYPGPLKDRIRFGYVGDAHLKARWQAGGRTFEARHQIKKTAKTGATEHYLYEVLTHELGEQAGEEYLKSLAGPNQGDFLREVRALFGDLDQLVATNFQNQDDSGSLVSMDDTERMEFARHWVGADRFDQPYEEMKARRDTANNKIMGLQGQLQGFGDLAAALEAAGVERDRFLREEEGLTADLERHEHDLVNHQASLSMAAGLQDAAVRHQGKMQDRMEAGKTLRMEVERLAARLTEIDGALSAGGADVATPLAALRELRQAVQGNNKKRQLIQESRRDLEKMIGELQSKIQLADDSHRRMVDREIADRRRDIADHEITIKSEEANLRRKIEHAKSQLANIQSQQRMLATAGCQPNFLPCPFIDAARDFTAQHMEADLHQSLYTDEQDLNTANFATAARQYIADINGAIGQLQYAPSLHVSPMLHSELKDAREELQSLPLAMDEREQAFFSNPENKIEEIDRKIAALEGLQRKEGELDAKREERVHVHGQFSEKSDALVAARNEYQELAANQPQAPSAEDMIQHQTRVESSQNHIKTVQANIKAHAVLCGAAEERLRAAEARRVKAAELAKEIGELEPEARHMAELTEFFSPRGVPQLLIETAIPRINEILQEIMADAMPEPMIVSLSTQKDAKTKKGKTREGLFIWVTDASGTRPVKEHCGGERNLVRKVLRFGVGQFEAERSGRSHGVYCIDEPTIGLDVAKLVPRMVSIIYRLTARYNQVLVIDHNPALLVGIPRRFEFAKVNGISEVVAG